MSYYFLPPPRGLICWNLLRLPRPLAQVLMVSSIPIASRPRRDRDQKKPFSLKHPLKYFFLHLSFSCLDKTTSNEELQKKNLFFFLYCIQTSYFSGFRSRSEYSKSSKLMTGASEFLASSGYQSHRRGKKIILHVNSPFKQIVIDVPH